MGGWKLEAFKMSMYMAFPVGLFYLFNQPQYFEKWVIEQKRELFPPDDRKESLELKEFIIEQRKKEQAKYLEALKKHS